MASKINLMWFINPTMGIRLTTSGFLGSTYEVKEEKCATSRCMCQVLKDPDTIKQVSSSVRGEGRNTHQIKEGSAQCLIVTHRFSLWKQTRSYRSRGWLKFDGEETEEDCS